MVAACAAALALTTGLFDTGFWVRIIGTGGARLVPAPEAVGVCVGLVGCALISPRLATWEATASRRLWPRAVAHAAVVLATSALVVLLLPMGLAPNPSPALSRAEWRADALEALVPHAASALTAVATGLIATSRLGARRGPLVGLLVAAALVVLQTTGVGAAVIPLAGAESRTGESIDLVPDGCILATALVTSAVALIDWGRHGARGLLDE